MPRARGGRTARQQHASQDVVNEEVEDELKSLRCIFGDLFAPLEDGMGCSVRVMPDFGADEGADSVHVDVEARFPEKYPDRPVRILVTNAANIAPAEVKRLQSELSEQAEACAEGREPAVYSVVLHCQNWLQTVDPGAAHASLYDEMQRRTDEASGTGAHFAPAVPIDLIGIDMFDAAERLLGPASPAQLTPIAARDAPQEMPDTPPGEPDAPGLLASYTAERARLSRQSNESRDQAKGFVGSLSRPLGMLTQLPGRIRRLMRPDPDTAAVSVEGSLRRDTPTSSVAASSLRGTSAASESGGPEVDDAELLRSLVFGLSLLRALRAQNIPVAARSALLEQLRDADVLPSWVMLLIQHPDLLYRACQSYIRGRRTASSAPSSQANDLVTAYLETAAPMGGTSQRLASASSVSYAAERAAGTGAEGQDRAMPTVAPERSQLPVSHLHTNRYLNDFVEQEQLGKGGQGVVVAAINRVDGRKYAIKKTRFDSIRENTLREVNTLSGLQHAHIVRYFQAWTEWTDISLVEVSSSAASTFVAGSRSTTNVGATPAAPRHPVTAGLAAGSAANVFAGAASVPSAGENSNETSNGSYRAVGALDTVTEGSWEGTVKASSSATLNVGESRGAMPSSSLESSDSVPRTLGGAAGGRGSLEDISEDAVHTFDGAVPCSQTPRLQGASNSRATGSLWQRGQGDDSESSVASTAVTHSIPSRAPGGGVATDYTYSTDSDSAWTWDRGDGGPSAASTERPDGTSIFTGLDGSSALTTRQLAHTATTAVTRAAGGRPVEMLYIQMEYCPFTLKTRLAGGAMLDEEARWRVLRQLLAALAYLHARGIIHRDVKPDNVFYDARNDIKLGDFGLAKFTKHSDGTVATSPEPRMVDPALVQSEMTKETGTLQYMAPEQAQRNDYDSKVDLFALGLIVIELWVPMPTAMERMHVFGAARRGVMPPALAAHPAAERLALLLLSEDPAARPSAGDVLKGDLLPASIADEQIKDVFRAMPDQPGMYERVVSEVFDAARNAEVTPGAGTTEDALHGAMLLKGAGVPLLEDHSALEAVLDAVKRAASMHGCIQMRSSTLGYSSASVRQSAVRLLSESGDVLTLCDDLRTPFAAWLCNHVGETRDPTSVQGLRRLELSHVFLQSSAPGGLPLVKQRADIDVVGLDSGSRVQGDAKERTLADAEVVNICLSALNTLGDLAAYELEVHVTHRVVLTSALAHIGVPVALQTQFVREAMRLANAQGDTDTAWRRFCRVLQAADVSNTCLGRAKQLILQAPSDAVAAAQWLRSVLPGADDRKSPLCGALSELAYLVQHLQEWSVPAKVAVRPFNAVPAAYHHGVVFDIVLCHPSDGTAKLVGRGGRYDDLVASLWSRRARDADIAPLGATGATLDVEKIAALVTRSRARLFGAAGRSVLRVLSSADVLVCSRGGGGLLSERMAVVKDLRAAGIPAEVMPKACPSVGEQFEFAKARNIRIMVTLAPDLFLHTQRVKVKALDRQGETEVAVEVLAEHIRGILSGYSHTGRHT